MVSVILCKVYTATIRGEATPQTILLESVGLNTEQAYTEQVYTTVILHLVTLHYFTCDYNMQTICGKYANTASTKYATILNEHLFLITKIIKMQLVDKIYVNVAHIFLFC